ncbi:MAG: enolase C-terminal domain-like protein [Verrucomicrobiota bacterium JB022]|nr:enolase C-terminal domain-like protein [Verrucomicrobiota bacterium JB022]
MTAVEQSITRSRVRIFRIPTASPESDGTLAWDATTLVLVEVWSAEAKGFGYTYADASAAHFIHEHLLSLLEDASALTPAAHHEAMLNTIRNLGQTGLPMMAISAVDTALWDLYARLLDQPLARLLGQAQDSVMAYGSGGFTSYELGELESQLRSWSERGLRAVKMKVGRQPDRDRERVEAARLVIGPDTALMVDANSAYTLSQARQWAEVFAEVGQISWLEQPLNPADLPGLHALRPNLPPGVELADGEYLYRSSEARRFLEQRSVDVLMPDVTRCGGYTGFRRIAVLAEAFETPLSAHCAPALTVPIACASPGLRHLEYFYDHTRLEAMAFEGLPELKGGDLYPALDRPGHGLELRESDLKPFSL